MVMLALLLQLSIWVAATNALFIWEACRVDGTCPEPEGKTADSRAGTRRSQPLALGIHRHANPVSESAHLTHSASETNLFKAGRSPTDQAQRDAHRLSRKYDKQGRRSPAQDVARPHKSTNEYNVVIPSDPELSNAAGVYQDGNDYAYFVQVEVGSVKKKMYMLLDTGAGTTWVMGSECTTEPCEIHETWDSSTSDTHEDPEQDFSVSYGSGTVKGINARDSISLGGVDVTMQFGVAEDASDDFNHFPFDGILGMSMTKGKTDSFPLMLKDSGSLESNVFSIYLDRGSSDENRGELVLGGINDEKYTGEISYTKIAKDTKDWVLPLDSVGVDDQTVGVTSKLGYIDTGTSFIFAAPEDVKALHELIPGAASKDGVNWEVPCDTKEKVAFVFSGKRYTVAPEDYISAAPGKPCRSNIFGQEVVKDGWLLGDAFFKNVYAVFDMDEERIGRCLWVTVIGDNR